ncbi:MAG: tetratricopeptide repeat protein [Ginsengibacter sp.]
MPFFFCIGITDAQTPIIDSFNNLIAHASSDTSRINLINKKISAFNEVNLDSAIRLGNLNVQNAEKLYYQRGVADAKTNVATSLLFKGQYDVAAQNLKVAEAIYKALNDSAGLSTVYSTLGMYYGMQSMYDTSITYFEKVIVFLGHKHNVQALSRAYENIAISYQMTSNYPNSLEYFQKALQIAEQSNDEKSQAYIYANLGNTYSDIQDTLRAEESLLKAIELAKRTNIKNVELYTCSNLASLYNGMQKYSSAYNYAIKASELAKEVGDIGMEASALSRAGVQLANVNKFSEAEALAKKGILLADSSKQPLNIYQTYSDFGFIQKKENKFKEAIPYYQKAFSTMRKSDLYDLSVADGYSNLSYCYEKTGNYTKALESYKMFSKITDSVRSKDNIRKATMLALNYDFDKKQQLAKAVQEKKDAEAKRIKNQQYFIIAFLGIIVLAAVIITLILLRNNKHKQRAYSLLDKQKKQTDIQKVKTEQALENLKTSQAQLIQSEKMASLGELTAGIAHEIQNPLNFVNNFSDVNIELLEELKEEIENGNLDEVKSITNDVIENEQKINHHGKRADAIVKGMLQHSRKSSGQKEPTDINALADEYLRLSYHGLRAKDKNFNATIETDFDNSLGKINVIPQDIGRVLLNLFNNAFYAVNEQKIQNPISYNPTVFVRTQKCDDKVQITVRDNGNGIQQKIIDKIFQPFFTTKPTGEGTGLGLSLSYDIIKAHGGEIKVESKEGEGSEFVIQIVA